MELGGGRRFSRDNRGPQIRINHRIRVPEVRVVAEDGSNLGVLSTEAALRRAQEVGLDLVEVNPKATPPVCKILDFGKYKYEEKKRQRDAKRKQTIVEVKEIKLRPKTDDHDLGNKAPPTDGRPRSRDEGARGAQVPRSRQQGEDRVPLPRSRDHAPRARAHA